MKNYNRKFLVSLILFLKKKFICFHKNLFLSLSLCVLQSENLNITKRSIQKKILSSSITSLLRGIVCTKIIIEPKFVNYNCNSRLVYSVI